MRCSGVGRAYPAAAGRCRGIGASEPARGGAARRAAALATGPSHGPPGLAAPSARAGPDRDPGQGHPDRQRKAAAGLLGRDLGGGRAPRPRDGVGHQGHGVRRQPAARRGLCHRRPRRSSRRVARRQGLKRAQRRRLQGRNALHRRARAHHPPRRHREPFERPAGAESGDRRPAAATQSLLEISRGGPGRLALFQSRRALQHRHAELRPGGDSSRQSRNACDGDLCAGGAQQRRPRFPSG